MLQRHLEELGIPYEFNDVTVDETAASKVRGWAAGALDTPLVFIAASPPVTLAHPETDELDQVLRKAGILPPNGTTVPG